MSDNGTLNQLTLFVGDSLARILAMPTQVGKDLVVSDLDYGPSLPESFSRLNQDGSWSKMSGDYSQLMMDGTSESYSQTWPVAGIMLHGRCYELPTLERPTGANGFLLLPTVTGNESKGCGKDRYEGSPSFRGAKMSEGLRICEDDPIYLSPSFAEIAMGFPGAWTDLETP